MLPPLPRGIGISPTWAVGEKRGWCDLPLHLHRLMYVERQPGAPGAIDFVECGRYRAGSGHEADLTDTLDSVWGPWLRCFNKDRCR